MGKLINIDNGGTLTDFCVFADSKTYHTKSLTTPYDLSKCLFDGMKKLAKEIYGDERQVGALLQSTDYIRYSTTQGTNALVERKGPRLGLLLAELDDMSLLQHSEKEQAMMDDLVDSRVARINLSLTGESAALDIVKAVNSVATAGANRIVLSINATDARAREQQIQKVISRKFPSHLLGVVPVLAASELADDTHYVRRTWSALINAFLHPAMERFLYSTDHRLKTYKSRNPLLIFRNDGGAARVAKTTALKTYSSGPRGGMEGVKALAAHYGFNKMVSYDVGGTTTDIGIVVNNKLSERFHGLIEDIEVSFPLAQIYSVGVGGSSIIAVANDAITVGPKSVGAAPGPACFSLGGKKATITDVYLLMGVLDPGTYFGGELTLDAERARNAVMSNIAEPLGLSLPRALDQMLNAWVGKISESIKRCSDVDANTTMVAFGGAGPLAATRVADTSGCRRIIIPGMGAVFSAYGIGFSPLSQEYRLTLPAHDGAALGAAMSEARQRATRDLFAEGIDIHECAIEASLLRIRNGEEASFDINEPTNLPCDLQDGDIALLLFKASKAIQGLAFEPVGDEKPSPAISHTTRQVITGDGICRELPVYRIDNQQIGACADGPAILEDDFFTGLIDEGWHLSMSGNRDLILEKTN